MTNDKNLAQLLTNHIGIKIYDRVREKYVIVSKIQNDLIYCKSIEDPGDFIYDKHGRMFTYPDGIVALVLSEKYGDLSLQPFDRVLARDHDDEPWRANIFSNYYYENAQYPYRCIDTIYKQCIPYEGNENLLATRNSPNTAIENVDNNQNSLTI